MIHLFKVERSSRTSTRKLPFLPRFGIVVDFAGRRWSFKQVPFTETLLNVLERGLSVRNFKAVIREQIQEINFPFKAKRQTVNVSARTVARRPRN